VAPQDRGTARLDGLHHPQLPDFCAMKEDNHWG
jgi:hypothetical protein